MVLGLGRGKVVLEPYNPKWADLFQVEKGIIEGALDDDVVGIEHIGSTAIPGMIAKPILDFMVAVDSLRDYEKYTPGLENLGYQFRRDNRDEQEHVLYVRGPEDRRTHYLKLTTKGSVFWKEQVIFRDYLISHPDRAESYKELKRELLEKHGGEREKYTKDKGDFIKETLNLADRGF
ncbi:MAG: GrpB family protein [Patescibacteria group bacterium]